MAKQRAIEFEGPSHEEGGIMLDIDGDMNPDAEVEGGEVMIGNRVYSDSMEVPEDLLNQFRSTGLKMKKGITFAGAAKKLSKMRADYEEMMNDSRVEDSNTGNLMIDRITVADQALFSAQQEMNGEAQNDGEAPEFEGGGFLTGALDWVENNPDMIGTGIGAVAGTLMGGQTALGAQLGGAAGSALGSTYESPEEEKAADMEREMRTNQMLSQAGEPFGGVPQYQQGGEVPTAPETVESNPVDQDFEFINFSPTEEPGQAELPGLRDFSQSSSPSGGGEPFEISAGNIANVANYIANRSSIDDTEANVDPVFTRPETVDYRDRSGAVREDARRTFEDMLESVGRSTAGEGAGRAAQQELFADYLQNLEGIQAQENQRADQIQFQNAQIRNQAGARNAQIANQTAAQNMQRRNQQDTAEVDARNALTQGFMGNQQMQQRAQRDSIMMAIQAYRDGDRGIAERVAQSMGYEDYSDLMDDYTSGLSITI